MKLLDAIKNLDVQNEEMINDVLECLKEREVAIEESEPFDCGYYYEKWEDKLSDLQSIIEDVELLLTLTVEERKEKIKFINKDVIFHQFTYGGLKRLTI